MGHCISHVDNQSFYLKILRARAFPTERPWVVCCRGKWQTIPGSAAGRPYTLSSTGT